MGRPVAAHLKAPIFLNRLYSSAFDVRTNCVTSDASTTTSVVQIMYKTSCSISCMRHP